MFCEIKSFFIENKLINFYHLYQTLKNKKFAKKDLSEFLVKDMHISTIKNLPYFKKTDINIDNVTYVIIDKFLSEAYEIHINGVKVMKTSVGTFYPETIWLHKNLKEHFKTLRRHSGIFKKVNKEISLYLKQNDDKKILKEMEEKKLFNRRL